MIRFSTLGTINLRAPDEGEAQAVLAQPMQIALLTYLVVARPRGFHRRDAILGLFWPELDISRARGALNQAVYRLRGSLGRDVIRGRGKDELGVDDRLIQSDVPVFEAALESGSLRRALELYRGDLLEGFFLSGLPAWERWLDVERARLQRRASGAAWSLADDAASSGQPEEAAHWGRRALGLTPGDETVLRRLITLLDGVGDRAGAVRVYEDAAELFSTEYETEPSPETKALIEQVRLRARPRASRTGRPGADATLAATSIDVSEAPALRRQTEPPPPARSPGRGVLIGAAAAVVIGTLFVAQRNAQKERSADSAGDPARAATQADEARVASTVGASRVPGAETEYQRGVYHLSQLDVEDAGQARRSFQRALDLDPTFADAWSGLAAALLRLSGMSVIPADEAFPRARAAAERTIELNPAHGEAHALLAWTFASYEWDTTTADSLFRRALELSPNSAAVHRLHSRHLRNLGRLDEALAAIQRARELDPLFVFSHVREGLIHYMARDYERAIEQYELLLRIAPEHRYVHTFIGLAEIQRGRYAEALAALSRADPTGTMPVANAARGYVAGKRGRQDKARQMLDRLNHAGASPVTDMQRALVHLGLGEYERVYDLLERGLESPTWQMRLLGTEPFYEPLRAEPRFQAILEKLGLSTSGVTS